MTDITIYSLFIGISRENRKFPGIFSYQDLPRLFLIILHHELASDAIDYQKKSRKVEVRKRTWKFPVLF